MYKFLTKNGQVLAFGVGILISIIFLLNILPVAAEIQDVAAAMATSSTSTGAIAEMLDNLSQLNFGLFSTILLIAIAAIAMVLFGLFQVASSFRTSWKGILGFAILVVVFLVAYSTANSNLANEVQAIQASAADADVTGANLKFIGGSIITLVILIVVAVAAFIIFEIINFFK